MSDPPKIKMKALGKAIRHLGGGRTLKDIARQGGLNKSMLSLYCSGKRYPRYSNILKVAKGLGCTPEKLEETMAHFQAKEAGELDRPPLLFGGDEWLDHLERGARHIEDDVTRHFLEGLVAAMRVSGTIPRNRGES